MHAINGTDDDQPRTIHCRSLVFTDDGFYVATNKTCILFGTKSFHKDTILKIVVDERHSATTFKIIDNMDTLLVGLSDGSVKVLGSRTDIPIDTLDTNLISPETERKNILSAKSCAIQNLIKEERNEFEASAMATIDPHSSRQETKNYTHSPQKYANEQLLLHGLSLHQHYVKWIEKSVIMNCLFVHCGMQLRLYDLDTMHEVDMNTNNDTYMDVTLTTGIGKKEFLVIKMGSFNCSFFLLNKFIVLGGTFKWRNSSASDYEVEYLCPH